MVSVELFQNLGFFSIGSVTIGWLVKSLFSRYIDKDFEKFKYTLNKENFKFSKLHEKRATVIEGLYAKLTILERSMQSFMSPLQLAGEKTHKDKQKETAEIADDFVEFCSLKRIYFNEDTCELLDSIIKEFQNAWIDFTTFPVYDQDNLMTPKDRMENWTKSWKVVSKEIPLLRKNLEDQFRNILGVD